MPMPASAPDGDAALGDVVAQAAEDKTAPSTAAAPARHAGAVPRKRKRKTDDECEDVARPAGEGAGAPPASAAAEGRHTEITSA